MFRLALCLRLLVLVLLYPVGASAQEWAEPAPVTILVSIDGFRPDYLDRGLTPNLNALAAGGVRGALKPSFPTKTFPNHYALVTGRRPDRNGIVGNTMLDPRRPGQPFSLGNPAQALDPFWWDEAEPLWVTAERAGVRTATMFWPGSEVAIHGTRPSDWQRYDMAVTNAQRVRTVIDWIRRPSSIRPRLVTLYFVTVDTAGHRFGVDSAEVNAAVAEVDAGMGELVTGLAALGQPANIVVVSDHGMVPADPAKVVDLATFIDLPSIIPVELGMYAAIEPAAGTDERVFLALVGRHEHFACWRKAELPARLHYGRNPRVAAIVCLADEGWTLTAGPPRYPVGGGDHGGDNEDPRVRAVFPRGRPGHPASEPAGGGGQCGRLSAPGRAAARDSAAERCHGCAGGGGPAAGPGAWTVIYWEDVEPGTVARFGSKRVERDEVIAFAEQFDPQPFHLSDEAAAQTYFGRLSASGWHTCAMTMRMLVDHMAEQRQAGLGSPGIDSLSWLRPVYPGDVLRVETRVLDKRASNSRPEMGSYRSEATVFNQEDEPVMRFTSTGLIRRRPVKE